MARILIPGASGAGKTSIKKSLEKQPQLVAYDKTDLDRIGHREVNDQARWFNDLRTLAVMLMRPRIICLGISNNWRQVARLPWDYIIPLVVSPEKVAERGVARDEKEGRTRKSYEEYYTSTHAFNQGVIPYYRETYPAKVPFHLDGDKSVGRIVTRLVGFVTQVQKNNLFKPSFFEWPSISDYEKYLSQWTIDYSKEVK
uniref:Uncharacterized protein n=1 Tax=viral metagenome TaxID=1070528 RepID=A0A2V0RHR8_9ZZZZ